MRIGPFTIARTKALKLAGQLASVESRGGWWPIVRESFAGAWQQNVEVTLENVLTHPIVFACVSLIASDIGKMGIRLVKLDEDGIWTEIDSPAFSPVLRKPNRYQNRIKFFEQWVLSKLTRGNTYVLKQRDQRGIVTALYILDPTRVRPLVAPDGSVYYELKRDDLSSQPQDQIIVPASEIIHDIMVALYHPLVGVSPIYASGLAATMGLKGLTNSANLFTNGSNPGGVLTAPGAIAQATADRLKAYWDEQFTGDNVGRVAVLGDGLKFEPMRINAVDSQFKEQMDWVSLLICSTYHVPAFMVGVGPAPTYNNIEALAQQYYSQCLQELIESIELCLDEGLGLAPNKIDGVRYGTEFDLDVLLRMDSATMMSTIKEGVGAGLLKPNEGRYKLGYSPVAGGDTPYLQQQYYSLKALNLRDESGPPPPTPQPALPAAEDEPPPEKKKHLSLLEIRHRVKTQLPKVLVEEEKVAA